MRKLKFFGHAPRYVEQVGVEGRLIVIEGTDGVGRSTHVSHLREWLEINGHAVVETGWTRSKLVGKTIDRAKSGHSLAPLTYTLLYACDFADRLEKEILPALRAGYVVLADRYVYTAWVRAFVRGADRQWVRNLFSLAPVPDLVVYLRVDVPTLTKRVLLSSGIDHWESGKDRYPDLDIHDAFVAYQTRILEEFDRLAQEYEFSAIDARQPIERVQEQLRACVRDMGLVRTAKAGA